MTQVDDYLPPEEILAQLAEEAAELAQAALKLRRVMDGTNPTPVTLEEAVRSLNEEMADVTLCFDLVPFADYSQVNEIRERKEERWKKRLAEDRLEKKRRICEQRRERLHLSRRRDPNGTV